MRRLILCLLCTGALFLAACGGGDTPTQEQPPANPTEEDIPPERATFEATYDSILNPPPQPTLGGVVPTEEGALEVPLPGTLVASATEDPDAGLVFDRITFVQQGGGNSATMSIEILQDGTVILDGVTSSISQEAILDLDNALDQLNFFGMQGAFMGPARSEGVYQYTLTVKRGELERMIRAEEGYMPPELQDLFARIVSLVVPSGPSG